MTVAVVLVVVVLVGLCMWGARRMRHPEQTASHAEDVRDSTSERFYSDADRPAGPDAEDPVGGLQRFDETP